MGQTATPVREDLSAVPTQEERYLRKPPRPCAEVACGSEFLAPVRKSMLCNSHNHNDMFKALGRVSGRHARTVEPLWLKPCNSIANPGLGRHWGSECVATLAPFDRSG